MKRGKETHKRIINFLNRFIHRLSSSEKVEITNEIRSSASPKFDYFLLVTLSCSIATLGLITNSPAVIIGAMLLAPLMSPIIGIGLASITGDEKLIKFSALALVYGAVIAILLSFLMTYINRFLPFVSLQELPAEILARIRPSPIDLLIALAGGLAASYALTRPNLSAALPGVAIATALMPPLCTIGIGLALSRWDVAGGASLLFLTNAITIAFASALIFFIRGFSSGVRKTGQKLPHSLILSAILVLILLIPLSFYSIKFFREASANRLINTVVTQEVSKINDSQLVDLQIIHTDNNLDMVITVRTSSAITYQEVLALQAAIVEGLHTPVSLKVDQIIAEELDPLVPPTPTATRTPTMTQTPGPSPTNTPLPSPTRTLTPTSTPTPHTGQVWLTNIPPMQISQYPGGPVIGKLRNGQVVTILYGRQEYSGFVWIEIMDEDGRIGWIPEIYVPLPTATKTSPAETP